MLQPAFNNNCVTCFPHTFIICVQFILFSIFKLLLVPISLVQSSRTHCQTIIIHNTHFKNTITVCTCTACTSRYCSCCIPTVNFCTTVDVGKLCLHFRVSPTAAQCVCKLHSRVVTRSVSCCCHSYNIK